jgi:hypothetical protein
VRMKVSIKYLKGGEGVQRAILGDCR